MMECDICLSEDNVSPNIGMDGLSPYSDSNLCEGCKGWDNYYYSLSEEDKREEHKMMDEHVLYTEGLDPNCPEVG